jgi:hypothetical protein
MVQVQGLGLSNLFLLQDRASPLKKKFQNAKKLPVIELVTLSGLAETNRN